MKLTAIIFALLCVCSFSGTGAQAQATTSMKTPADQTLDTFFKQHLEAEFSLSPMYATRLGDHRFDALLDDVSAAARQRRQELAYRTLEKLPREVDYAKLSRDGQVDFEILRDSLKLGLWLEETERPSENDPRGYTSLATECAYVLLTQSTLPKETNIRNAIARIKLVPAMLAAARENLRNPPRVRTETAIQQNTGAIAFYESELFEMMGETPQRAEAMSAAKEAATALKQHQTFLEKELLPRSTGDWRIGKEGFARKLELVLDAGVTADQVLAEAEGAFAQVHRDMLFVARQLWPRYFAAQPLPPDDEVGRRETIQRVITEVARDHGAPEKLSHDARETVDKVKQFIVARDILRLPEPDRCQIIEMPEFQRGNSVAFLEAAPPLDTTAASIYAISPPPRDWSKERVESFLGEYNRQMLQVLTIHEAYPGHYVQLDYANRNPSLMRSVLSSGVYAEGWANYCEQMILDQGYGDGDLALRLMQLKFLLRSVANAILDHKMHCTPMTDEEALSFLTTQAFQSEGEARLKVTRAKLGSCQLSTYFVGRGAFMRLRASIQRELGGQFELGRFHEAALAPGTVPVKYLPELTRARLKLPR
ncbi:DUF885 domain-containing protein [soil metagenome]